MGKQKYYDMLGLQPGASEFDIKDAYRTMALELDPNNNKSEAVRMRFLEITHAFKHLSEGHTCDSECDSDVDTGDEDEDGEGAHNMYDVFTRMFPGGPDGGGGGGGGGYNDYLDDADGEGDLDGEEDCGCLRCQQRYRATPRPGFRAKPMRNRHRHDPSPKHQSKKGGGGKDKHGKQSKHGGDSSGKSGGSKRGSGSKAKSKQPTPEPPKRRNPYAMDPPIVTQLQSHAITVQWVNPNSRQDCGAKITKYTLMLRQAENTPAWAVAYVGKERNYKIPCVTAGCAYQLKVRAENSLGLGNFSPIVTCTTPGQRAKGEKHPDILSNLELASLKKKQDEARRREAEAAKRRKAQQKKQQQEEQRRKKQQEKENKEKAERERRMAELIEYERMKKQMAKDMEQRRLQRAIEEEKEILRQSALRKQEQEERQKQEQARRESERARVEAVRKAEEDRRRAAAEERRRAQEQEQERLRQQQLREQENLAAQRREAAAMARGHVQALLQEQKGRLVQEHAEYAACLQCPAPRGGPDAWAQQQQQQEHGRALQLVRALDELNQSRRGFAVRALQKQLDTDQPCMQYPMPAPHIPFSMRWPVPQLRPAVSSLDSSSPVPGLEGLGLGGNGNTMGSSSSSSSSSNSSSLNSSSHSQPQLGAPLPQSLLDGNVGGLTNVNGNHSSAAPPPGLPGLGGLTGSSPLGSVLGGGFGNSLSNGLGSGLSPLSGPLQQQQRQPQSAWGVAGPAQGQQQGQDQFRHLQQHEQLQPTPSTGTSGWDAPRIGSGQSTWGSGSGLFAPPHQSQKQPQQPQPQLQQQPSFAFANLNAGGPVGDLNAGNSGFHRSSSDLNANAPVFQSSTTAQTNGNSQSSYNHFGGLSAGGVWG